MQQRTIKIEELNTIFSFLERKRVRFFDLQIELADHLATAIEVQWESEPNKPLEEALSIEYKKFGITGFSKLVEKKTRELEKQARRTIHRLVLEWLNFPKILISLVIIIGMAQILQNWNQAEYLFIGTAVLGLFFSFYGFISQRNWIRKQPKRMLFLETENQLALVGVNLFFLPVHIGNIMSFEFDQFSFWLAHLVAIAWWYFGVFTYEMIFNHYQRSREKAIQLITLNEVVLSI